MYIRRNLKKLILASVVVGGLTFTPEIYFNDFPITSVAYAEIQTFTGVGVDIGSDDEPPAKAKQRARENAERNALEQAGIFLSTNSTSINGKLTKDEITIVAGGIIQVTDSNTESIPLEDGYNKYRVTVTAQIDTAKLEEAMNKFLQRDDQARSVEVDQYEALKKLNDEQAQRIKELEEQIARASTIEQKEKVREEYYTIDKEALFIQKLETANKLREEGKHEEAIQIYGEAIQLKQTEPSVYFGRACSYYELKNYNQAIEDYNKSIQLNPNRASVYDNRGIVYAILQNYVQAIEDFNKSIQLDPNDAKVYYNRGITYCYLKDYQKAIEDYNKAIQLDPNYAAAYCNRGWVYTELKNYKQAIEDYTKAIQINPNYAYAYNNRGIAYKNLQNYKQAIADYDKAIQIDPNYARAYNNRGYCYQAMGDNEKAQADFAKAKELENKN